MLETSANTQVDELMLETSANTQVDELMLEASIALTKGERPKRQLFYSLRRSIYAFNSVVNTKLPAIFLNDSIPFFPVFQLKYARTLSRLFRLFCRHFYQFLFSNALQSDNNSNTVCVLGTYIFWGPTRRSF